jgi:hypothetical protein
VGASRGCNAAQFHAYPDGANADVFVCPGELTAWEAQLGSGEIVVTQVDTWLDSPDPVRRHVIARIPTVATSLVFLGDVPPRPHDADEP